MGKRFSDLIKKKPTREDTLKYGKGVYLLKPSMELYKKPNHKNLKPGSTSKPYLPGDNETFNTAFGMADSQGHKTFIWKGKLYKVEHKKNNKGRR